MTDDKRFYEHIENRMIEFFWRRIPKRGERNWEPKVLAFVDALCEVVRVSKTIQDPDLEKALEALEG